jgi:hypothetical protein
MNETSSNNKADRSEAAIAPAEPLNAQGYVYVYESAGIAERDGPVPVWLWMVVVSLMIWGAYYLVTYWNAPIGPT